MPGAREGVFERGSNVVDYWLAHCEGFKLGNATSGRRVAAVVCDRHTGHARTLLVESRRRRPHMLPARTIAAVDPFNKVLYLEPRRNAGDVVATTVELVRPRAHRVVLAAMASARRSSTVVAAAVRNGSRYGKEGVVWLRPRSQAAAHTTFLLARKWYAETAIWLAPRLAAGLRAVVASADALVVAVRRRRDRSVNG